MQFGYFTIQYKIHCKAIDQLKGLCNALADSYSGPSRDFLPGSI
jgi:hypothetical protein